RNRLQRSIRRITPGMIGTYKTASHTRLLSDDSRSAMAARVFEGANDIVRTAADDDRLAQFLEEFVGTRRWQLADMPCGQPGLGENLLQLQSVERRIAVSLRRQGWDSRQIRRIFGPQSLPPEVVEYDGVISVSAHAFSFCPTVGVD